jgi:hypothetical protein
MTNKNQMIDNLFDRFPDIRYIAIYVNNDLFSKQRDKIANSSSAESDKYEELIVNPTLLTLTRQRGNIDCGGLSFMMIGYGNFYQIIKEIDGGHISICLDKDLDLTKNLKEILDFLK